MSKINKDNVIELLERAVAEKGEDYVDPNAANAECVYFDESSEAPCCIVGHVIAYVDPTHGAQRIFDAGYNSGMSVADLADRFPELIDDEDVLETLRAAQNLQDAQGTWGHALAAARATLPASMGAA